MFLVFFEKKLLGEMKMIIVRVVFGVRHCEILGLNSYKSPDEDVNPHYVYFLTASLCMYM